ncbi:J domain-containing protein spf31 [Ceratobasidium theobromae]|uniref:J domain-containing protein spf31 n=1 Tax=Ceratobasidium theobromae TaxID=1582974 RepID=A0A5N5QUI3_9AGAM|nr:J domain-containing protein spf31 [Ceratobasidium theobromae]
MAPSPPATEPVSPKVETSKPSSSKLENTASKPVSNPGKEISTDELDKLLAREASAFQRDVEVERILTAFKLNPYDILGLDTDATPVDIKKRYRHLSLFIHPDKATHPRATDAFDLLKKAEADLSNQPKRDELDAVMLEARAQTLKAHSLPTGTSDTDPRVLALVPSFKDQIRACAKDILIDEEVRRRKAIKMNLANEGLEARRKEEEAAAKKRKAEEDAQWEETRDQRVDSWRSFNSGKKKKKSKLNVIG